MRVHIVRAGDTLESIAQLYLYQASRYIDIQHINNLATKQIAVGQSLKIPDLFEDEKTDPNFDGAGIIIDGTEIVSIPSVSVSRAIDSFSAVADFAVPNELIFRNLLKPFGYNAIDIYYGNDLLFSGKVLNIKPNNPGEISVSCKGKCGILESVNLPPSSYPRTRYNTSFKQIATEICDPYAIVLDIDSNASELANKKFVKFEIGVTQNLADFLIELARQRNLILSETPEGALRVSLDSTVDKTPILNLVDPVCQISFDADKIYSDYSVLRSTNNESVYESANKKFDIDIFRMKVIEQQKRDSGSSADFIKAEMISTMLSSFGLSLTLPYIKTMDGKFLLSGEIITIQSDRLYLKNDTDFIISDHTFDVNDTGKSANLKLFPLEWYKGNFVKFWE